MEIDEVTDLPCAQYHAIAISYLNDEECNFYIYCNGLPKRKFVKRTDIDALHNVVASLVSVDLIFKFNFVCD